MNKELYILRHGQTRFNAEDILEGHCYCGLLTFGGQQTLRKVRISP
ncbi:MAG: hypothetical protein LPD71_07265 [Shewanella sp.]|nr:hypothetical protein [Shewanella sp.]MCF1458820.1 hypothetical protein [Shewanella sp.]